MIPFSIKRAIVVFFFLICSVIYISAQSLDWRGQVSSWLTVNPDPKLEGQIGLRYIPTISIQKSIGDNLLLDGEVAGNFYGMANHYSKMDDQMNGKVKLYRLWLRFSGNQFELRAGLQKINFGSATLLRALMWFDRIDPRDPLQLTDGIYGLLGRYYFLNNANIWLWGLYSNDETKGWEVFPSIKTKPEFGGRIQVPLWTGEIGITGHHRIAYSKGILNNDESFSENRLALDGKWDVGVGLWFEGAINHSDLDSISQRYNRMLNLGMDYTFDIENGLHVLAEYLKVDVSSEPFKWGESVSFSALSLNYPLGLLDNLNSIFYYDWSNESMYRFLSWQRTYDQWSFYVMGFWNPSEFQIYQNQQDQNLFAGKGFQFMVVFNH
ncbi:MAG: hypothetical protein JW956_02665 [Calditrichaceae bacterium]|nr:hypothetical protein [Calditrichaceae bacterium]